MRPPLSALLLAPDTEERRRIENGERTITIREGYRDYREGQPVMLCCHIEPWCVMADIVQVRHCTLGAVTDDEMSDDGHTDLPEMLADLREFYPALTATSPVTVIRWANVRGKLVRKD